MSIDLTLAAHRLLALLTSRQISAREVVDATLARIETINPRLNAIIAVDAKGAIDAAERIDAARRKGEDMAPLAGLPVTIKDAFDVAGFATVAGVEGLKENRPATDAVSVARLRAAGAIIIGKTNVPPMSGDFQTYNPVFGTTSNPWKLTHTPGGSSGGAAAAIAAGLSALELGSDLGGSIRWPAHACGIFGLKPTHGIIPATGGVPPAPGTPATPNIRVASPGPLARSAKDLALGLQVMAGPEEDALGLTLPRFKAHGLKGKRIAMLTAHPLAPTQRAIQAGVVSAGAALASAGTVVEEIDDLPASLSNIHRLFTTLMMALVTLDFPEKLKVFLREKAKTIAPDDPSGEAGQARGAALDFAGWMQAEGERARMEAAMKVFFQRYDAILCPPATTLAFAHDHGPFNSRTFDIDGTARPHGDFSAWSSIAGLLRLPAVVAPVGMHDGLPHGVQIIAPPYHDLKAIALAGIVEKHLGGARTPPLW